MCGLGIWLVLGVYLGSERLVGFGVSAGAGRTGRFVEWGARGSSVKRVTKWVQGMRPQYSCTADVCLCPGEGCLA